MISYSRIYHLYVFVSHLYCYIVKISLHKYEKYIWYKKKKSNKSISFNFFCHLSLLFVFAFFMHFKCIEWKLILFLFIGYFWFVMFHICTVCNSQSFYWTNINIWLELHIYVQLYIFILFSYYVRKLDQEQGSKAYFPTMLFFWVQSSKHIFLL